MKAIKFLALFCLSVTGSFQVFSQTSQNPTDAKAVETQNIQSVEPIKPVSESRSQTDEKYRIGLQDTLEILVAKHKDLSLTVNVSPDGSIRLPRIDKEIVAVCKTERELQQAIEAEYKTYLKNPYVNVLVKESMSQPVAVIGAVEKPGSFNLTRKMRLLELLSFAGGPKVEKAGSKIQVARVGTDNDCNENTMKPRSSDENVQVEFISYNLSEVQKGVANPWVKPGDIVSVLEAEEAYVVGNVKEPKKVLLKEPVTLTQAIAAAGGIAPEAKTSQVRIQRKDPNSPIRTETVYDLKDIASKKIPDPVLQANDIVNVPKNGITAARNNILKALGGSLTGIFMGL